MNHLLPSFKGIILAEVKDCPNCMLQAGGKNGAKYLCDAWMLVLFLSDTSN